MPTNDALDPAQLRKAAEILKIIPKSYDDERRIEKAKTIIFSALPQLLALAEEAERLRGLLERSVEYFDYMEERGYSSVRVLRSDVISALAAPSATTTPRSPR